MYVYVHQCLFDLDSHTHACSNNSTPYKSFQTHTHTLNLRSLFRFSSSPISLPLLRRAPSPQPAAMDKAHHRRRRRQLTVLFAAVVFLFLASASAFSGIPSRQLSVGERKMREEVADPVMTRRRLGGPGSSPPSCRSKCGRCRPCQPVHVPIHPGVSMKLEYYPEAWRCKCKDRMFMP